MNSVENKQTKNVEIIRHILEWHLLYAVEMSVGDFVRLMEQLVEIFQMIIRRYWKEINNHVEMFLLLKLFLIILLFI